MNSCHVRLIQTAWLQFFGEGSLDLSASISSVPDLKSISLGFTRGTRIRNFADRYNTGNSMIGKYVVTNVAVDQLAFKKTCHPLNRRVTSDEAITHHDAYG